MPTYPQAKYWLLTIPHYAFLPYLPPTCCYIRGQLEQGESTEFLHWQLSVCFNRRVRLSTVRETFGPWHAEASTSKKSLEYVWKDDTAIVGTRFELGKLPISRSSAVDWEGVRTSAKHGRLGEIPADIYVRYYSQLRRINQDNLQPIAIERKVTVYWGPTGIGKSRRAWNEAGLDAYPKDPRSKFWDGYRGHKNVVIDEFRGGIDISHVLRWFDRYPVIVEVKGSSEVLRAEHIWITSNLDPRCWYVDLDIETKNALLRRIKIIHMCEVGNFCTKCSNEENECSCE